MLVCAGGGILCWVLDQRRYFFLFCAKKMSLPASQPGTNGGRRLLSLPSSPLRFRSQGALCCPSLSPPHEPAPAPTSVPAAGAPLVGRNAAAFAGNKGCGMFLRPAENPASRGGAAAFGGPGALAPGPAKQKAQGAACGRPLRLSGRFAPAAAPPPVCRAFPPAARAFRNATPRAAPHRNKRAAPDGRRASTFPIKTEKA